MLLLALGAGCAGSKSAPGSQAGAATGRTGAGASTDAEPGESPFPSQAEIDRLAGQTPPEALAAFRGLDVDTWELVGPFPERIEVTPHAGESPWDALLAEEARRRAGLVVPTEAMHCVARQMGRFFLANQATPTNGLQSYVASRCNAAVPSFRVAYSHAILPSAVPESEVFEQWRSQLSERIRGMLSGGPLTAGIWFGRNEDYAVAMVVTGTRAVHVEPVDAIPGSDGRVRITGEVLSPAAEIGAMIGQGRFGYADCDAAPDTRPPRFDFSCPAKRSDESAMVTITYTPPGRLLGKVGLNVLVWPGGTPHAYYRRPSYGRKHEVTTAQSARSRFVEMLNEVRKEAGLQPLTESKNQSAVASELAPHYFAAARGLSEEQNLDVIVMGMLAGWNVEGVLQNGHFTAPWVTQTNDVNRLLSEALQFPSPRAVLLAPDIDRIAVGALIESNDDNSALAALVGTYTLFSETAHNDNAAQVYERFQAAREEQGLRPADRLQDIEVLSMAAASRIQAGAGQTDVLNDLLQSSVDVLQRPVNGWMAEVSKLEDLEFPDDFLSRTSVGIAVGVSYHKPADQPWGQYVVLVVAAGPKSHRI